MAIGEWAPYTSELEPNGKLLERVCINVYETSRAVGYATIAKTLPPEVARKFAHHSKPAEVYDYFVLFSRKTPSGQAWAIKFESGLRKLKASGAYDRMLTH